MSSILRQHEVRPGVHLVATESDEYGSVVTLRAQGVEMVSADCDGEMFDAVQRLVASLRDLVDELECESWRFLPDQPYER